MKLAHTPMSTGHWYWSEWPPSPPSEPRRASTAPQNSGADIFWTALFYRCRVRVPRASRRARPFCVLSLTLFQSTIRYSCFSVLDGQDFHLRHHHVQKDASICPPSWLVCIIACLSLFIANAKSLQMPHHFLFSVPVIFQPFFFLPVCIIIICPERALSERGLFVLQPGTQLFSGSTVFFPSPSVQLNTPGKFAFVSDISFFFLSCWPLSISPHQFKTLPRYCQSFWSLIVSTVFFAQRCLKDI